VLYKVLFLAHRSTMQINWSQTEPQRTEIVKRPSCTERHLTLHKVSGIVTAAWRLEPL